MILQHYLPSPFPNSFPWDVIWIALTFWMVKSIIREAVLEALEKHSASEASEALEKDKRENGQES